MARRSGGEKQFRVWRSRGLNESLTLSTNVNVKRKTLVKKARKLTINPCKILCGCDSRDSYHPRDKTKQNKTITTPKIGWKLSSFPFSFSKEARGRHVHEIHLLAGSRDSVTRVSRAAGWCKRTLRSKDCKFDEFFNRKCVDFKTRTNSPDKYRPCFDGQLRGNLRFDRCM